jgi:hypothetical protein
MIGRLRRVFCLVRQSRSVDHCSQSAWILETYCCRPRSRYPRWICVKLLVSGPCVPTHVLCLVVCERHVRVGQEANCRFWQRQRTFPTSVQQAAEWAWVRPYWLRSLVCRLCCLDASISIRGKVQIHNDCNIDNRGFFGTVTDSGAHALEHADRRRCGAATTSHAAASANTVVSGSRTQRKQTCGATYSISRCRYVATNSIATQALAPVSVRRADVAANSKAFAFRVVVGGWFRWLLERSWPLYGWAP